MNSAAETQSVWLGYNQRGSTAGVSLDELRGRLLLVGQRANEMAALLAFSCSEAGLRPLILDLDGYLSSRVSGYFEHHYLSEVLYDLYRMDEYDRTHAELIAAAYTSALDLNTEEEAIIAAAMQKLAAQDNIASPPVLYDALSGIEGFRGFYVDKLKGRMGTLKSLDAADSGTVRELLSKAAILDLSKAGYPGAAELGAALFLAKVVALLPTSEVRPSLFLVNGTHRIFKNLPRLQHGGRLLLSLLGAPITNVLASDLGYALLSHLFEACPIKILSSDAWNKMDEGNPVLPNAFVLQNGFYGTAESFVPRTFESRVSEPNAPDGEKPDAQERVEDGGTDEPPEDEITTRVLEQIRAFSSPTRSSLVAYLSVEFPTEKIERTIDNLQKSGEVELVPKQGQSGRVMLVLALTTDGEELLRRLTK